ncbi:MAG: Clp protease N-terminal domain-containing protein [Candidatus Baltobacteraceae bacterium]
MFSRFSPAARRVLRAAEQECRNHNHYYVGVEHVLLALLEERDPQIEESLRRLGARSADVYAELRRALGTGEDRLWDGILVTPRVRTVVQRAESALDPDAEIEPLDLFEAIRAEGQSVSAAVLRGVSRNADTASR